MEMNGQWPVLHRTGVYNTLPSDMEDITCKAQPTRDIYRSVDPHWAHRVYHVVRRQSVRGWCSVGSWLDSIWLWRQKWSSNKEREKEKEWWAGMESIVSMNPCTFTLPPVTDCWWSPMTVQRANRFVIEWSNCEREGHLVLCGIIGSFSEYVSWGFATEMDWEFVRNWCRMEM